MKKPIFRTICFLLAIVQVLASASTVQASVNYESYSGFVADSTPVLPGQESHPKLWFDTGGVGALYAKRLADPYAASLWNSIRTSPYLTMELPQAPGCVFGNVVHAYYGEMARIAKYNAFLYLMEGNEQHKERAVQALLRAYDGPIYTCADIDPNVSSSPIDETYRANWAQNFAAAYDWMQPHLTPQQDAEIRDRLAFEAQTLYDNIWIRVDGGNDRGWGPRPHNHRSKPAWGLGSLALALSSYSKPGMNSPSDWLKEALESANSNLSYFFSSDGIYREGSQYYIYSHINFVPFLYHYKNVSGVDQFRLFKPAFLWEFNVSNNKGWMPNFADSFLRHNFLHMVAGQFMTEEDHTSLHPDAKWGNLFQWRYMTTDTSPWGGEFGNNTGASYDDTMDLDKYLTYESSIEPIAPTGTGTSFFLEGGQTIFRNNWLTDDPSSRYLLFQGVAEADNHNHFDHLSYIIHAENQMMASDAGYSRSAYGDAERRTWYRTAPAHNTATLDGKWPVDFAQNDTPPSLYSMDTDFFDFQQKSARFIDIQNDTTKGESPLLFPPDSESLGYMDRAVAFPGQQYFVIADQLRSRNGTPRNFSVYVHGGKGAMSGSGGFRQWVYPNSVYGSAAKLGAWIFADNAAFTDRTGEVSYVKDDYTVQGYVEASKQAAAADFLQILIPMPIAAALPEVKDLSNSTRTGGTVAIDGNLDTYMLKGGNGNAQVGHMESNGSFAYVRDSGLPLQYMVREASSLRYRNTEWLRASAPVTVAADVSRRDRHTGRIFTPEGGATVSLRVPAGKQVQQVLLNAEPAAFVVNGSFVAFQTTAGEAEFVLMLQDAGGTDKVPPGAVSDLSADVVSPERVRLQWTAPGNDGTTGTADYYDVRYHTSPITDDNWDEAVKAAGEPTPGPQGTVEAFEIGGLFANTSYYFAVRAGDESGNVAALSNVAALTMPIAEDVVPPAAITDLRVVSASADSVVLEWTATGNDGYVGTAAGYDLRYSTNPITEDNFESAVRVTSVPTPLSAGSVQSATVQPLLPGRTYFMAMKAYDVAGNRSALSNWQFAALGEGTGTEKLGIIAVTADEHDGNVPGNVVDGDFTTRWSALSQGTLGSRTAQRLQLDLGAIRSLSHIKIAYHSGQVRKSYFSLDVSADGTNWTRVISNAETSGLTAGFEAYELNQANARYVRLLGYGNSSSGWNSISEIEVYGTAASSLPAVTVGAVLMKNAAGEPVEGLPASGWLDITVPLTNNSPEARRATAIVVLEDGDGRTLRISAVTGDISGWETDLYAAGLSIPEHNSGGLKLRVFVWNELMGLEPLAETRVMP